MCTSSHSSATELAWFWWKCHTSRGAHRCLQSALLDSKDFHMEYTMSQDISSSEVKPPVISSWLHTTTAPLEPALIAHKGKLTQLSKITEKRSLAGGDKHEKGKPVEWTHYSHSGLSTSLEWERVKQGRRDSQAFPLGISKQLRQPSPAATPHLEAAAHAAALEIIPRTLSRWFPLKRYLKYLYLSPSYQMTFLTL